MATWKWGKRKKNRDGEREQRRETPPHEEREEKSCRKTFFLRKNLPLLPPMRAQPFAQAAFGGGRCRRKSAAELPPALRCMVGQQTQKGKGNIAKQYEEVCPKHLGKRKPIGLRIYSAAIRRQFSGNICNTQISD